MARTDMGWKDGIEKFGGWLGSFPELSTRPRLVRAFQEDNHLRKVTFKHATRLVDISGRMSGCVWAHSVLDAVWKDTRQSLLTAKVFCQLDERDYRAYNEAFGFLRNVLRNCKGEHGGSHPAFTGNDVKREW